MAATQTVSAPLLLRPPHYRAVRPYRKGVLKWLWGVIWKPVLWLCYAPIWKVRMGQYTERMYQLLQMPSTPRGDCIELGQFRPADSLELVKAAADLRVEHLKRILGVSILYPANRAAMEDKLFHTWDDFITQQKHFETPTRTQEVGFGHSLHGFARSRQGYLDYLAVRAPDLHQFLITPLPARLPVAEFAKHGWVLGMTGSGKSELCKVLAARLKATPRSTVIILDPERKLAEEVAQAREHATGDELVYIDPTLGRSAGVFPILNPLDPPSPEIDDQATYAEAFVDAFAETIQGEVTERMMTLLKPCVQVLLQREGSTLADLQRFFDDRRNSDLVALGQAHPRFEVREFFANSFPMRDWTKTKEPLQAKLQALRSTPAFADCVMGRSSLSMRELITSRKTVVLTLDEGTLGSQGSRMLGAMFVALLESTLRRLRSGAQEMQNPDPIYLIVDELPRFVTPRFGQILTRARRLGLHLIGAQQYVGQDGTSSAFTRNMNVNTNVKLVGHYANPSEAEKAAKIVGLSGEELAQLGSGRYAIKAGKLPPIIVQVQSDRLGQSNAMDAASWQRVCAEQCRRYYRRPDLPEPPSPPTPQGAPSATTAPTQKTRTDTASSAPAPNPTRRYPGPRFNS